MSDPCSYAGAFWNGATYLKGLKSIPLLFQFSSLIVIIAAIALLCLCSMFIGEKQAR
jgi:hypothetical protein